MRDPRGISRIKENDEEGLLEVHLSLLVEEFLECMVSQFTSLVPNTLSETAVQESCLIISPLFEEIEDKAGSRLPSESHALCNEGQELMGRRNTHPRATVTRN
jgi:hypothetical protein